MRVSASNHTSVSHRNAHLCDEAPVREVELPDWPEPVPLRLHVIVAERQSPEAWLRTGERWSLRVEYRYSGNGRIDYVSGFNAPYWDEAISHDFPATAVLAEVLHEQVRGFRAVEIETKLVNPEPGLSASRTAEEILSQLRLIRITCVSVEPS